MVTETAIVKIHPQGDGAVTLLYDEAKRLLQYAIARVVNNDEDAKIATNDLAVLAKLKKAIEEKRKEYVGPINEHLKSVNDTFKQFTEPLNEADTVTRQKVLAYRKEQERIRQEQERINQLRLEAAQAEMKLKGELTESVDLVEVKPEQPEHYRTDMGMLGKFKVPKFEVVDFSLVPDEYKTLDTVKVGKVIRAGVRSIPGLRIWEEESLRVTTK